MSFECLTIMSYNDFLAACATGDLAAAKQFDVLDNKEYVWKYNHLAFRMAYDNGHEAVARWLYSLSNPFDEDDSDEFIEACSNGDLYLAKTINTVDRSCCCFIYTEAFQIACKNGHLSVAKWLYSLGKVDHNANEALAFCDACNNGHIDVVEWLLSLGRIKFSDSYYFQELFQEACVNGHLAIAQLIHSIAKVDGLDELFRDACHGNHIAVAKWLHSLGADIHSDNDQPFRLACWNGNFSLAKWIYSVPDGCLNIHAKRDHAFKCACTNGHAEIAEWLICRGINPRKYKYPGYKRYVKRLDTAANLIKHWWKIKLAIKNQ